MKLLSFLGRYWLLLAMTVLASLAALNDTIFQALGALIYVPAVSSICAVTTYLIRHFIFRQTIDEDVATGFYVAEWKALPGYLRIQWAIVVTCVLFLSVAIIAASVGR